MQQSKQLRTILLFATIVVSFLIVLIALKSQEIMNTFNIGAQEKDKVVVLTSDVVNDQSWGGLAYKGKIMMEEQFPINVQFTSDLDTDEKMEQALEKVLKNEPDVIIGHGREFSPLFTKFSPNYADTQFVTIHGDAVHDNQSVYTFDQNEIEYIAGIMAALKTNSNKVGLIDVDEARSKNQGFEKGLLYYNSKIEFYYEYVGSRDDGIKATQILKDMIDDGVDVIYSKGNAYNQAVINYAKERDVYVIGYLEDQSYMAENIVLTSVLNDVPQAYIAILQDYYSTSGIPSGKVMLHEEDGVYKLAPYGPMFTEDELIYIESEIDRVNRERLSF
ncbi:BMP family ABC transporter substrate-binding protein [Aquibacillus koreensis]|uniref:BMP family ABC transporter substrate-binding protein n=1 Tax=Aquibacillus koreensis TaxID=279446 RepID=A0A9X3WFN7_9BACI|nr:BMP family ABC transporter substrate-binding protein [Aquibacillus koreensis]MCT2537479.1 BMP family ABC transporter substrate-binding protein [Aquibacillus koreensis]MDC3418925.1 BMP family ABC transporter substrate-binding protein [Aquibacillus koreensis]